MEGGVPVLIGDVATVREGPEPKRGTASYRMQPAVILSVQKQPDANTLELTGTSTGCSPASPSRSPKR